LVCLAADCGVQSPFIQAMGGRYLHCATCVIATQHATSIVNRCWSGFPCKWRYINVETFNLFLCANDGSTAGSTVSWDGRYYSETRSVKWLLSRTQLLWPRHSQASIYTRWLYLLLKPKF